MCMRVEFVNITKSTLLNIVNSMDYYGKVCQRAYKDKLFKRENSLNTT